MKYAKLRAAAGSEILAVIENLPVSANGHFLTPEQMTAVEAVLNAGETSASALVTANNELATQRAEVTRLTGELSSANGLLTTAQSEVTRLGALAGKPSGTDKTEDEFEATTKDPMSFDFQQQILKRFD